MSAGDAFKDNTPAPSPAPKKRWHWPDPNGTGIVNVQAGESLAQAIQREGPIKVFKTAIPFACRVTITMDVQEE